MGRQLLLAGVVATLFAAVFGYALTMRQEPPARTATVLSVDNTDQYGNLKLTVQVDGLERPIENAGESGVLKTTGKIVTVTIGKWSWSSHDVIVGKQMHVFVGQERVTFWHWKE